MIVGGVLLAANDTEAIFRFINFHHTPFLDVLMFRATMMGEGAVITVALLVMLGVRRLRNWWYITAALLSGVLPSLITQAVKRAVNAPRPLKFFGEADWMYVHADWPRYMENSFPSGHTCGAFAFFTLLALLLPPGRRVWGLLLFLLAALVGYSRIYLVAHFPADVLAGSIIGAGLTLITVAILNKYRTAFFRK